MLGKALVRPKSFDADSEKGAVLVIGAFLAGLGLLLGVLVVDISLAERSLNRHQAYIDAAALAGAMQLRMNLTEELESIEGWRASKVAVFKSLSSNIQGVPENAVGLSCDELPEFSPDEPGWRCLQYNLGDFTLRVERGIYWRPVGIEPILFSSLENLNISGEEPGPCAITAWGVPLWDLFWDNLEECMEDQNKGPYLYANSIQLRLIANSTPAPLASKLLGIAGFKNLATRQSISSRKIARPGDVW